MGICGLNGSDDGTDVTENVALSGIWRQLFLVRAEPCYRCGEGTNKKYRYVGGDIAVLMCLSG